MSIRKERRPLIVNGSSDWNSITNKPSAFPTMPHDHEMGDVYGLSDWEAMVEASIPDRLSDLADDVGFMKTTDKINYSSVQGTPSLAPVALSGQYSDLAGRPTIPTLPTLSTVATSGQYADLLGKPTIPTISYPVTSVNTKTGAVVLSNTDVGAAALSHTHTIANITGLQTALDAKQNTSSVKRQETYSGVSDASGNYTVLFSTPFNVAPNIQTQVVNGTHNISLRVSSVSTTGFTVSVGTRASLAVLGLSVLSFDVTVASGVSIDVLVTSK